MKQIRLILIVVFMLVTMLGLLFFVGAIYDSEKKHSIETYFFETNNQSGQRVASPVSPENMPQNYLRERIVEHFLYEYFYVIPDSTNANTRANTLKNPDGTLTPLAGMTTSKVKNKWKDKVVPDIVDLADKRGLRTVQLLGIQEAETGHLVVDYKLMTWTKPNDVLARPDETTGRLFLNVKKQPIRVRQTQAALDLLKDGTDPVSVFLFEILDVIQENAK